MTTALQIIVFCNIMRIFLKLSTVYLLKFFPVDIHISKFVGFRVGLFFPGIGRCLYVVIQLQSIYLLRKILPGLLQKTCAMIFLQIKTRERT